MSDALSNEVAALCWAVWSAELDGDIFGPGDWDDYLEDSGVMMATAALTRALQTGFLVECDGHLIATKLGANVGWYWVPF